MRTPLAAAALALAIAGFCGGCKNDEAAENTTPPASTPASSPAVTSAPASTGGSAGATSAASTGGATAGTTTAASGTGEAASQAAEQAKPGKNPVVELDTSMGKIRIQLDTAKAPVTTKNFLEYVNSGFYNGTIFHRVIPDFMIQGGGFDPEMNEKKTREPIRNEGGNGLKNARGTVAMARTSDPDSATAQFFINLKDNAFLNRSGSNAGYAVFGKVISGMDVVDKIAAVKTTTKGPLENVPEEAVTIKSAKVVSK